MSKIDRFYDLDCWKKARILENEVFKLSQVQPLSKDYGLKDQINRATGSVMDNIAEGFGRGSNKEFINFLIISKASCLEVQSQIIRAKDRNYLDEETYQNIWNISSETVASITNFINYLRKNIDRTIRKPL